jgi:hypothetical protein
LKGWNGALFKLPKNVHIETSRKNSYDIVNFVPWNWETFGDVVTLLMKE